MSPASSLSAPLLVLVLVPLASSLTSVEITAGRRVYTGYQVTSVSNVFLVNRLIFLYQPDIKYLYFYLFLSNEKYIYSQI